MGSFQTWTGIPSIYGPKAKVPFKNEKAGSVT